MNGLFISIMVGNAVMAMCDFAWRKPRMATGHAFVAMLMLWVWVQ